MTDPAFKALGLSHTVPRTGADGARPVASGASVNRPATNAKTNNVRANSVQDAIANAARSTTIDFDFLVAQAQIESAMNPQAQAPTSSARGLYQFIESTWLDTMKRHGGRFGMSELADKIGTTSTGTPFVSDPATRTAILDLRNDPQVASFMAAGLAEDNREHLLPILGRQPDSSELYLAHFLGAGGAGRFLSEMQDNPSQSAASLFRRPAAANRAIFYEPNGSERSLAGVMDYLGAKMDRALNRTPQMPSHNMAVEQEAQAPSGTAPHRPHHIAQTLPQAPLSLPGTSFALPSPSTRQSMSSLLGDTFEKSGASQLASPQTAQRIERAYSRLRAMGL